MDGECLKISLKYVKTKTPPPNYGDGDGCFALPVFWDPDNDEYKNDQSTFVWFTDTSTESVAIELLKNGNTVATLTNNIVGEYMALGFITNRLDQLAYGYRIFWNAIGQSFGAGTYQIKATETDILGATSVIKSLEYNLVRYNTLLADTTVRLEWNMLGETGWYGEGKVDYMGKNLYMQIRVPNSVFSKYSDTLTDEYEREVKGRDILVGKTITNKYQLEVSKCPFQIFEYIQIFARQSDYVTVTDYCINNFTTFTKVKCLFKNGAEIENTFRSQYGRALFEMEEYVKNKVSRK